MYCMYVPTHLCTVFFDPALPTSTYLARRHCTVLYVCMFVHSTYLYVHTDPYIQGKQRNVKGRKLKGKKREEKKKKI